MLKRSVPANVVLIDASKQVARIVSPAEPPFRKAALQLQGMISETSTAVLQIHAPADATVSDRDLPEPARGHVLRDEFKNQSLILVGNLSNNPTLFEPHLRRWVNADKETIGEGKYHISTWPNAWGNGAGLVFILASDQAGIEAAVSTFGAVLKEHGTKGKLVLPRLYLPGRDPLQRMAASFKRCVGPKKQDLFKGLKTAKTMHLGYHNGGQLFSLTHVMDTGYFSAEEVNDLENELLTNLLMIPEKVWWWMPGAGEVKGRHEMYKNPRFYLACQHLLKTGRPNAAAKAALEKVSRGPLEYLQFASANAYRSDHEGIEADHGWQNGLWFSLVNGDWNHFTSGRALEAARYALLQTDNLGGLSGHIQYGYVQDLNATSDVRNAIRTAAWYYRDAGLRWVLDNMPLKSSYAYSFAFNLPIENVPAKEPVEWLGVQSQPLSPFSYDAARKKEEWGQLNVPRDQTVDLLAFREGFSPEDQYLCIDGFQAHFQPRGLNSVVRYVDRGKLFLVAHTGKSGNFYKSGVVVSSGTQTQSEAWGVKLDASKNWVNGGISFSQTTAPGMNGCDWERSIIWKRGEYFLFIDRLTALSAEEFNLTATWRTGYEAVLNDNGWQQRQGDVTFHIKSSFPLFQDSARQPDEEYQNEVVPWLLQQTQPLIADKAGEQASFQNLMYASGPGDEQNFEARRLDVSTCIVRGNRIRNGKTEDELALICLDPTEISRAGIETDARMLYLSPETIIADNGTFVILKKASLLSESGTVSDEHRKKVTSFIEKLWKRSKPGRQPSNKLRKYQVKEAWAFDGFKEHHRTIQPISQAVENGVHVADLGSPADLAKVVLVSPADVKSLSVEFSNDRFQKDVRKAPLPELTSRIHGPYGKSFFANQKLAIFAGQNAKSVRITAKEPKRSKLAFEFLLNAKARPQIVLLKHAAEHGVFVVTRDHQLSLLGSDGQVKWSHQFPNKILAVEALDVDNDGTSEIVVSAASSHVLTFSATGEQIKDHHMSTNPSVYSNFFRNNRPYALGLWQPNEQGVRSIVMGTYQSIVWIRHDGGIEYMPENSDDAPYRSGYVWRGLIYWNRILKNGHDFNNDGVEDTAVFGRGWATEPTICFFDGKKHNALAEYSVPNSRPLGFEVVSLNGRKVLLAVSEFHLGLYSMDGAKELWRLLFDTPASAYSLFERNSQTSIAIAKRDGLVLLVNDAGKVTDRQALMPGLNSIAQFGDHLAVGSERGVTMLKETLKPAGLIALPVNHLLSINSRRLIVTTTDGRVVALD